MEAGTFTESNLRQQVYKDSHQSFSSTSPFIAPSLTHTYNLPRAIEYYDQSNVVVYIQVWSRHHVLGVRL